MRAYPPIEREMEFYEFSQRRKVRREGLRQQLQADPSISQRAIAMTRAFPWLRPGVISSLTQAGLDVDHPAVARAAALGARQAQEAGDFRPHGSRRRTQGMPAGHWLTGIASLGEDVQGAVRKAVDVAEAAAAGVNDVLEWGAPGERARADILKQSGAGAASIHDLKQVTRGLVSVLDWAGAEGKQFLTNKMLGNTGPEIGAGSVLSYGGPEALGTGALPGGPALDAQTAARDTAQLPNLTAGQREALTHGSSVRAPGSWASPGRLLAQHVFEPGSKPFNFASGLADAALTIVLDPTNVIAPGKSSVARLQTAGYKATVRGEAVRVGKQLVDEVPRTAKAMTRLFGGVKDVAPTTLDDEIEDALSSTPGRRTVEHFANADNFTDIWELTKGKLGARTTEQLRAAKDPQQVRDILAGGLRVGQSRTYPFVNPNNIRQAVRHRTDRIRMLQTVPARAVDAKDLDGAVTELIRSGRNAKVAPELTDRILQRVGNLEPGDAVGLMQVVKGHNADIVESLLEHGSTRAEAEKIAGKIFDGYDPDNRAYFVGLLGEHAEFPGARHELLANGQRLTLPSPHIESELLNRAIPLPDYKEARRATSMAALRPLLRNRDRLPNHVVRGAVDTAAWVQSSIINPAWLLKGSWLGRVTLDLQNRMAFMGLDSLANHPFGWMTWALSADKNVVGKWAAEHIGETGISNKVRGALAERGLAGRGRTGLDGDAILDLDRVRASMTQQKDWFLGTGRPHPADHDVMRYPFERFPDRAVEDWADELLTYAHDPVMRESARLKSSDMKEWFAGAGGAKYRENLARAHKGLALQPEEVTQYGARTFDEAITTNRAFMDNYAESYWRRLSERTNDHGEVLEALARHAIPRKDGTLLDLSDVKTLASPEGKEFSSWLGERVQDGPTWFKGLRFEDKSRLSKGVEAYDKGLSVAFEMLFSRGDQALSRGPTQLQFYWKRVPELVPFMSEEARNTFVSMAKQNKLGKKYIAEAEELIAKTPLSPDDAVISAEMASDMARKYAWDETSNLLYDQAKKHQYSDIAKTVSPFAEPLTEALSIWPKLASRSPKYVRRAQQVVSGAQGAGIFYQDPVTDEMTFAYPSADLAGALGMPDNIHASFTGQAANLQTMFPGIGGDRGLLGGILPGVGPVVQIPAARWLPDRPGMEMVEKFLFPFGRPDPEKGIVGQAGDVVMPAWFRNFDTAWIKSPEGERAWDNTVAEVMQAGYASGRYTNRETGAVDFERMENDARKQAKGLYILKGVAQFFLPTGGKVRFDAPDAEGHFHMVEALAEEMKRMQQDEGYNEGTQHFLEQFGPSLFAAVQTPSVAEETESLTKPGASWEARHPELVKDYRFTRSFFAPGEDGEFDIRAYMRQFGEDVREVKSPEQYGQSVNRLLGNIAYDSARKQLIEAGHDPAGAQGDAWLGEVKEELEKAYPGYGYDIAIIGLPATATKKQKFMELERAASDPRLLENEDPTTRRNAQSLAAYMDARRQANEAAVREYGKNGTVEKRDVGSAMNSPVVAHYRDWLREVGARLVADNPGFKRLWERVLVREMVEDDYRRPTGEEE